MPDSYHVSASDAGATLGQMLYEFPPSERHRGTQLFRAGRVLGVAMTDGFTVEAVVEDRGGTVVWLRRGGPQWTGECSQCGMIRCRHVFAAVLAWLVELNETGQARAREGAGASGLDPATAATLSASVANPPGPVEPAAIAATVAEKLGRPLAPAEKELTRRLGQLFQTLKRHGRLGPRDIERLGFATRSARENPFGNVYEKWWPAPPRSPLELWQYVAYDLEESGLAVPEHMQPVTDTAPIRAYQKDRVRRETVQRWTDRFRQIGRSVAHAPRMPPREAAPQYLDVRLRIGENGWVLETRAQPEAAWKVAPKNYLEKLNAFDEDLLTTIDASPAVFAFLALCQQHRDRHYGMALRLGSAGTADLLHALLSHPLARTLVCDGLGRPFAPAEAPLVWRIAHAEGGRDYEFKLHLPDGRPLPPGTLHLPGRPDFYLHEGQIYRGPPALDGSSAAGAIVPAEAVEQPETLRMLRQLGTQFPAEIERRFVPVTMRARIECVLDHNAVAGEYLLLHLYAVSDRPAIRQEWGERGWTALPAPQADDPANEPDKLHTFDTALPELVASRLDEAKLAYDGYRHAWTRRVTKTFPEEFLAWRAALPPEVEVLATGELASLLEAPLRARVDFEVLESAAHRDWFDLALALRPEDSTLTPAEVALLLKARGKLVRLPGRGWRRLHVEIEDASAAALEAAGFDRAAIAEAALAGEKHRLHALQLAQSAIAELLPQRQAAELRSRARTMALPEPPALPAGLRAELRPYQKEGYHFLAFLSANRLGGVLADDMGLGKTVQTLAWLLWLAARQPAGMPLRALAICPKSVVGNWEAEAARFAPGLRVVRYAPEAGEALARAVAAEGPLIVVANYVQLRLNAGYFSGQRWTAVVLDEGQFIKTPSAKVAQVARELPGEHRLILTGTPIENRLLDLWSLFAFALPGLLGPQAVFKRQYRQDDPLALGRLRARVRHFLLRRTKAQVATDLPPRTEEDVTVELEGDQARLYQAELKRARAQLLHVNSAQEFERARFNILASLLRLRQICCHPQLVSPEHRAVPSAKLEELLERLEELRDEGHQVLVFSQFVAMLEIIRARLETAGIGHLMLTGQTENREELVAQFQAEKRHTVFLLSLKAAGFGLNLTAASYVILYDPWWNPAVEAQAIDRTHRIGQSVPVNAYRLIARGTVEEKIRALQREKAALAGAVVQEESLAQVLDLEALKHILS